ncbi:5-oxoprolinase subunit PxpB [Carboxydothermus pertinax]|uniref:Allophanate hydrolase n=1 Tax=Carboxydothermus pertinax TaxID=870242 RepID=A0A1L8CV41_9THEO|nr:5-oxoprolinase subunit PxpB [Carboxydothermus pertinax]GAV22772.1 allophanate hydrolase [Carboxydothermus pertinax]
MLKIYSLGEGCLGVYFEKEINLEVNQKVMTLDQRLKGIPGIIETVPTYRALAVYFEPLSLSFGELKNLVESLTQDLKEDLSIATTRVYRIPVVYGGEFGPDLLEVARINNLTPEEVVAIHTKKRYYIYMLGFTPGFPYLGGLDPRIAAPRKVSPRPRVEAGSVGIAGMQTGIYPLSSPGGWQIIGRTPLRLFNPENPQAPFLLEPGGYIEFYPISVEEYFRLGGEA